MFFFISTIIVGSFYLRIIKNVHKEYKYAKEILESIIINFNGELKKQNKKLDNFIHKTNKSNLEKQEDIEYTQLLSLLDLMRDCIIKIEANTLTQYKKYDIKLETIIENQTKNEQKIQVLESKNIQEKSRVNLNSVIPIKKEKVLAPLTQTELLVLDFLREKTKMSSSEIKTNINLSREHTSRLLRKLYDNGYLERDTRKIPYVYNLKKEMIEILKPAT